MSNVFSIYIADSDALITTYGAGALLRVQSSATVDGVYADITDPTQLLVSAETNYGWYDPDGIASDWYAWRAEASDGDPAGDYSDPFQPMPLATVYASLSQFKAFVRDDSTDDDDLKALALAAASRSIDRATNTTFPRTDDIGVPPTITAACLLQASRFWKRRDAPFGIAGSPVLGNEMRLLAKLDPDVEVMLWNYVNWWSIL